MGIDFEAWKTGRRTALTADDGWLNLTDRVGLTQGAQTVGTAKDNDIIIRSGPLHLGVITLTTAGGMIQLHGGLPQPFVANPETSPYLRTDTLLLELHSDGKETALRVRDLTLPRDVQLSYFPHDPAWFIRAEWLVFDTEQSQMIDQKGGAPVAITLTHAAHFNHAGHDVTLVATHWKLGKPMFVIRDATSGRQTYAASRFLIGEDVSHGHITLDFNRAFSPPCAFSDYAICPLPPRSNILPFAVLAGEIWP